MSVSQSVRQSVPAPDGGLRRSVLEGAVAQGPHARHVFDVDELEIVSQPARQSLHRRYLLRRPIDPWLQ